MCACVSLSPRAGSLPPPPLVSMVSHGASRTVQVPPEFCEYGDSFDQCSVWIAKNCPHLLKKVEEEEGDDAKKKKGKRGGGVIREQNRRLLSPSIIPLGHARVATTLHKVPILCRDATRPRELRNTIRQRNSK